MAKMIMNLKMAGCADKYPVIESINKPPHFNINLSQIVHKSQFFVWLDKLKLAYYIRAKYR
jgi:hypothetical protein